MAQLLLCPSDSAPETIDLPPLQVGPIPLAVGYVSHVLRDGETVSVRQVEHVSVSARIKEPLYTLSSGEKLVVTTRARVARPEDVDGVLQKRIDGTYRWVTHRRVEAFLAEVEKVGWPALASQIASQWDGKVSFKAERPSPDGSADPSSQGLRPPQLGALHAIGAHWSLHSLPATIVMPTGTGKTETMLAALAAYVRGPLLVLVPWDLLRQQTAGKFLTFGLLRKLGVLASIAPNPIVGIVTKRPTDPSDLDMFQCCNVVVATASSLTMGTALPLAPQVAQRCSALMLDEAHHLKAPNWSAFRAAFDGIPVLQFTATPFRRDGQLVDGQVIYSYPLGTAQRDGYFKRIVFEPIYEVDRREADRAIADAAVARLREDLAAGRNHLLMARCASIERATEILPLYESAAPDLNPMLVHSELDDADHRVRSLRAGESRIVVCVNMLGEGFDLPQLKIAAVHDMHRSLAILLQFTGRFTRTAGDSIGDATVVANIADPDVSGALERLYSEDADWNKILSELSSEAAREHAELVEFLSTSQRLDDNGGDTLAISHQLLRPPLSAAVYRVREFHPRRFHEGLPKGHEVYGVWLHRGSNTLYFVTKAESSLRWTRSKEMRDRQWSLFVLHYDASRGLLYLSSTDHSSMFRELAAAVSGDVTLISGDTVFRTLGHINRLIFQNVGVKKHGRRNLSYASYTGADVATALGIAERSGSVKNNLSGTGWEGGERVAIGCSYKGRVWSREQSSVPGFVKWCRRVGDKLLDDTIDTAQIIANVLIPEEVESLPEGEILGIEWPVELLGQSEERVVFSAGHGADERPLFLVDIVFTGVDRAANKIRFDISAPDAPVLGSFALTVGGAEGYRVDQIGGDPLYVKAGVRQSPVSEYLSDYPPMVRFVNLCELDGNMLIRPQQPQEMAIPDSRFEAWNWSAVDIKKESIWKYGTERRDSVQWHVAQHYIAGEFGVVFDDDSAGEAADLVCLKEEVDQIRLALVHCKFSGGRTAGERIKDVVEVCSQAVRSAKWKWRFRDLLRHIAGRERHLASSDRPTRFLAGRAADLSYFAKVSRFKEIRAEILIVQPGISARNRTPDQNMVLASTLTYLKETIGADLDIVCSA